MTSFLRQRGEGLVAMTWHTTADQTPITMNHRNPRSGDWGTQADAGPGAMAALEDEPVAAVEDEPVAEPKAEPKAKANGQGGARRRSRSL